MDDLFIPKPHAEIYEVKRLKQPNEETVRVYCVQRGGGGIPSRFALQIRTHKPINGPSGSGKPRDMVAHVEVFAGEVRQILAYMEGIDGV